MMFAHCILILFLISSALCDDDCPNDKSHLAPIRLRKNLLCGYDKNSRPVVNHKDAVPVMMKMLVKYINYDMHMNSFTVDGWLVMLWFDEHLKWNPDEYESIKSVRLQDTEIWMPDISVYNKRDQGGDTSAIDSVNCIVSFNGQVICVASTQHTTLCTSDFTKYPFDTHNCTLRFGSWVHSGEELNITHTNPGIGTDDMVPNGEWDLLKTNTVRHPGIFKNMPNNTYPSINFSFKIERIHAAHTASVILPAVALVLTTLTSLWISPSHSERLPLCYVNFIAATLYLQYTSYMIPWNGDKIPLILLFARDSLMLSAITIFFSVILKSMVDNENPAPEWMSKIVCTLTAFKPGQIAFLTKASFAGLTEDTDDVKDIISSQDESARTKEWLIFARIFDRIIFVIYLIVYFCMFIAFFQ